MHLKVPEAKDVFVGELAKRGRWWVASVNTSDSWPVTSQRVAYRGAEVWVLPLMEDFFPSVATHAGVGRGDRDCELILTRFLSSLAWVQEAGYLIEGFLGGSLPRPLGRSKVNIMSLREDFDLSYLPEPTNQRAMLALALMREGWGLNHPAYAFLSFFRALEVAIPAGKTREAWVSNNVDQLQDHAANRIIKELRGQGVADIGQHLWDSGRNAIAHAGKKLTIDPDDPSGYRRLSAELPLIRRLAQRAIEEFLSIQTSGTVWKEHLYELAGFKEIIGPELVSALRAGQVIEGNHEIDFPEISVRLRRRDPYPPLEGMAVVRLTQSGSSLIMSCVSQDGLIEFNLSLDFAEERVKFNMFTDIVAIEDGTAASASNIAHLRRFSMEYFLNGKLQIYSHRTGALLSRKDAFLPTNMTINHEVVLAEIATWEWLALARRDENVRYADELRRWFTPYSISPAT